MGEQGEGLADAPEHAAEGYEYEREGSEDEINADEA